MHECKPLVHGHRGGHRAHGGVVQTCHLTPMLKVETAWFRDLKQTYDNLLSKFAFDSNLRSYGMAGTDGSGGRDYARSVMLVAEAEDIYAAMVKDNASCMVALGERGKSGEEANRVLWDTTLPRHMVGRCSLTLSTIGSGVYGYRVKLVRI